MTIADISEVYGFRNGEAAGFDTFHGASDFWNHIANGPYLSNKAKMNGIRNPTIRYVSKLLANTFFARKDAGAVTMKELCLLYQGLKHLISDMRGVILEYEFGDDINYGCIFAAELVKIKSWAATTYHPDLFIGAMLTPLLVKAGVDLSQSEQLSEMGYLNRDYLVASWFLKGTSDMDLFHYRMQLRNKEKRVLVLPRPNTNTLTFANVRFEIGEDEFFHQEQGQMAHDEASDEAEGSQDLLEQLNAIDMPEIDFTARTTREKLIQKAYKAQRKINQIQKKLINKLFRKVKKIQPPNYVSSEEEEYVSDSF